MDATVTDLGDAAGTRDRLRSAAAALFIQHSFAGTSHQMVADELGITKAAVHYHFRTREDLLVAVMEPMLVQTRAAVHAAEQLRGIRAKARRMLIGYADVVSTNRLLAPVVTFDPSVRSTLHAHPVWQPVIDSEIAMLAAVNDGSDGFIKASAVLTGLTGAATGAPDEVSDADLAALLVDIGRRILGLRASG